MAREISKILEDKLGQNIMILDLSKACDFTDAFVLSSATSDRMLNSLADAVTELVKKNFGLNAIVEGTPQSGWIVLDYGYVIVHLMAEETREYYQLEELWNKGKVLLHLK